MNNLSKRERDENRAISQTRQKSLQTGGAISSDTCCKSLHLSLFFDGTNNNRHADERDPLSTSNVARLYHATVEHPSTEKTPSHFRYYCPGVGTVFPDIDEHEPCQFGLVGAAGGESRINWGLTRLIDALHRVLLNSELGVAETKDLVAQMNTVLLTPELISNGKRNREQTLRPLIEQLEAELGARKEQQKKPEILSLRLYVYGFSRGAAEARTFCNWLLELVRKTGAHGEPEYRFAGLPISIEFLGIFDTVAAVGLADSFPFAAGHMSWADGTMRLPDEDTRLPEDQRFLNRCVHLVSAHEQRASFPLDSIRRRPRGDDGEPDKSQSSSYRANSVEYVYPGMHSDVGGGYPAKDQGKAMQEELLLSQITLHHMYREAFAAGAPLLIPKEMISKDVSDREPNLAMIDISNREFSISPVLIERFNAWQAQAARAGNAPLEEIVERETELITGWRIDRYHNGLNGSSFYENVKNQPDEAQAVWDARKHLHAHKLEEKTRERNGEKFISCERRLQANRSLAEGDCPGYSEFDEDIRTIGGLGEYQKLEIEKAYEPTLDNRQLQGAAAEFSRDYRGDWKPVEDDRGFLSGVIDSLSGVIYLINEEDEAKQFKSIHTDGTAWYHKLFLDKGKVAPGYESLVALFDDHIHDSRAWFMNSSGYAPREMWTDYFRYRLVHFDQESNKSLTPLLTAGRVIGLAIAVGSIGLAVKRRDPRYLLGLILPTLGVPVIRGKLPMPESSGQSLPQVSAFDPLTGIAYPMMEGIDHLRAYTREPGTVLREVAAMPLPQPLTEQTATTPELQTILKAAQAAKAVAEAKEGNPMGLVDMLAEQLNEAEQPDKSQSPDWLDMAGDIVGKKIGIS
ncbi:DUF2235 domain-containing protein [Pseudomonas sp. J452]|uniref:T6SS phospholipase effector Tle1-like catalytic domain-containing protein n=1 Tax=Pseudomonas sp. J452 TaxID=2898441 RepID=UPI0021AE1D54|nr:DUF2235 domain-containing protein [Pseudomonas sp. J452]UUY09486.1 DUF2235 domain-containing protein [Pseudomonas sp. J452]